MSFPLIFFYLSIGTIFSLDIFSSYNISELSFFFALTLSLFLFLSIQIGKKKIYIPVKETIFYLIFIIFSIISTSLAIDKEVAVQSLLIYVAGYFFFIFAFNYQENLNKYFKWFLIIISIFSSLIFLINKIHPLNLFNDGSSLFYNGYYHNEVGNVIILGILVCLYLVLFKKKNIFIALLLFFLPFFIFSYSRSAYLAIIIVGTIFFFIKKNWSLVVFLVLITSLFFVTTKEIRNYFPSSVDNWLVNKLLIPEQKSLTGKRFQHFYYALKSIKDKPLFGVGPGNLYLATVKYQFNREEMTMSAHNILLDIIAENGTLAGVSFLIFLAFIFKRMKKNLYFYLFLSLTLIFLFDFSYRYTSMLLIWIILAGITLNSNKDDIEINNMTILLPVIIVFIFGQIILIGKFLNNIGLSDLSLKLYPLNSDAYMKIIETNIKSGNTKNALNYLIIYDLNFKDGHVADYNKGKFYEELNDKKNSIYFYKKTLYDTPILASTILNKIVVLYVSLYGERLGRREVEKFINQFRKEVIIPKKSDVEKIIKEFCYDYKLKC